MHRLLPCLLAAALILPSCAHKNTSADALPKPGLIQRAAAGLAKYGIGMQLKAGWKDGGPYVGFQLSPPTPSLPSTPPSSPPDAAGRAFDSLVSPVGSSGKTPVPAGPS